jgi:hypothetical protein
VRKLSGRGKPLPGVSFAFLRVTCNVTSALHASEVFANSGGNPFFLFWKKLLLKIALKFHPVKFCRGIVKSCKVRAGILTKEKKRISLYCKALTNFVKFLEYFTPVKFLKVGGVKSESHGNAPAGAQDTLSGAGKAHPCPKEKKRPEARFMAGFLFPKAAKAPEVGHPFWRHQQKGLNCTRLRSVIDNFDWQR